MRSLPAVPVQSEAILFQGGADFVSPQLQMRSGLAREAQNWELDINGGYRRILGYERYDGRAKPSDAAYAVLVVTLTGTPVVGETVTGATSGATGVIIATADGELIITKAAGTFGAESISGSTSGALGTCTGPATTDGAGTSILHAQYRNLAADEYRDDIAAVPGSGNVLGVWVYSDKVYAFRNNAGGTAVDMYKKSASGWTLVALGRELAFTSGGTYEVLEGDTITGVTSGATAQVTRVVLESGSWAAGSAAGRFIFASQTGTFVSENLNVGANLNVATISADGSAITFATPSGRFEFVNHNFGGSVNTTRMYGCDGKNRGFEFDGTVFVPIKTGMSSDAPEHVIAHKNHLFFSFAGSVQHSGPGTPYIWTPVLGAAEIAMGDTVTGFMVQPGGGVTQAALAIFTRNNTSILYGTSSSDWQLMPFDQQTGAYAYSIQHVGFTVMLDDRGVVSLTTSQNFGNFASATLSKLIQTWVNTRRALVTASCIIRDKNQYRLFFSDGTALFVTIDNRKVLGMMPMLFTDTVRCACSAELSDGSEVAFFGTADGFVYQMEKGTSFDGDAIEAFLHLVFNHSGTPLQLKTYRGAMFEVEGDGYAEFEFSYELGYATTELEQPGSVTVTNELDAAKWDEFTWDAFYWDGKNLLPSTARFIGTAENFSFRFLSNSDYFSSMRISGAVFQYTPRRRIRIG